MDDFYYIVETETVFPKVRALYRDMCTVLKDGRLLYSTNDFIEVDKFYAQHEWFESKEYAIEYAKTLADELLEERLEEVKLLQDIIDNGPKVGW